MTNVKQLKFVPELVPLILSGEKTVTWRLYDDKNLTVGDELSLINRANGSEIARARVTDVRTKTLGDVTQADYDGHERYESREAMFATFRNHYGDTATADAPLKIVKFELLK